LGHGGGDDLASIERKIKKGTKGKKDFWKKDKDVLQ